MEYEEDGLESLMDDYQIIDEIFKEEANPSINICEKIEDLFSNPHSVLLDANTVMASIVVHMAKEQDDTIKLISYWNFNSYERIREHKLPVAPLSHKEMMVMLKEVAKENMIRSNYGLPVFNFRITRLGKSPAGDLITFYPRIVDDATYWESLREVRETIEQEISELQEPK